MNKDLLNKKDRKDIQVRALGFAIQELNKNSIYSGKHLHKVIIKTVRFALMERGKYIRSKYEKKLKKLVERSDTNKCT